MYVVAIGIPPKKIFDSGIKPDPFTVKTESAVSLYAFNGNMLCITGAGLSADAEFGRTKTKAKKMTAVKNLKNLKKFITVWQILLL